MFHLQAISVFIIIVTYGGLTMLITDAKPFYNPILCKTSVSPLNNKQIAKLRGAMSDQIFLDKLTRIQRGEDDVTSPEIQRPLITFSAIQKRDILQKYGEIFVKKPEFHGYDIQRRSLTSSSKLGIQVPGDITTPNEENRTASLNYNGHRVCPPVQSYAALVISFDENNNPVQVVQFPEDDAQQWFMEESCKHDTSPVSSASCHVTSDRLVDAYILPLTSNPPAEIKMGKIRVHSCVGFV